MLTKKQMDTLLQEGLMDKVLKLFNEKGLTNVRIHKPQNEEQEDHINFLVKSAKFIGYSSIEEIQDKLKQLLDSDAINLITEHEIDEDLLPHLNEDSMAFTKENILSLYRLTTKTHHADSNIQKSVVQAEDHSNIENTNPNRTFRVY